MTEKTTQTPNPHPQEPSTWTLPEHMRIDPQPQTITIISPDGTHIPIKQRPKE